MGLCVGIAKERDYMCYDMGWMVGLLDVQDCEEVVQGYGKVM